MKIFLTFWDAPHHNSFLLGKDTSPNSLGILNITYNFHIILINLVLLKEKEKIFLIFEKCIIVKTCFGHSRTHLQLSQNTFPYFI